MKGAQLLGLKSLVCKRTGSKRTGKWILISALELHPSGERVPLITVRLPFASILRREAHGYDQRYCCDVIATTKTFANMRLHARTGEHAPLKR
jgi:hypothetical protein